MRALCASIITAGSLIGLGLAALGVGTRYHGFERHVVAQYDYVRFRELDTALSSAEEPSKPGLLSRVKDIFKR